MYQKMELTPEEIRSGVNTGNREKDLELINAYLSGNVAVKQEQAQPVAESQLPIEETPAQQPDDSGSEEVKTDEVVETPPVDIIDPLEEELEKERKYREFVEEQKQAEREKYLLELRKHEEDLDRERKAREELEKKLQELNSLQKQQSKITNSGIDEITPEEEEYLSDTTKRLVKEIKDLKGKVGDESSVRALEEQLSKISTKLEKYDEVVAERERQRQEEAERQARNKLFDGIRKVQQTIPELKTKKDIEDVEKDFLRFREDFIYLTKSKSWDDYSKHLNDYMNGGEIKKVAEERGVKMPEDFATFQLISELDAMKRGVKFNPTTGKEEPILNDEGEQVKYRSFEEAYRVKNFDREIESARKRSVKELSQKLKQVNGGAVEIPESQIGSVNTGLTKEQEREIMGWNPRDIVNDPNKVELLKKVYLKYGQEPPSYRGRRL